MGSERALLVIALWLLGGPQTGARKKEEVAQKLPKIT
jgi:hypothetical protein